MVLILYTSGSEKSMIKKNFKAQSKEQTDLLTDPFGLTVLAELDPVEFKSATVISKDTKENKKLIKEYLEKMEEHKMVETKNGDEEKLYRKKADYYSFSSELLSKLPDNIQDHWIFGLLHALEGDYYDFLKLASKYEDIDKALEVAKYPSAKYSLSLIMNRIYIEKENIEKLEKEINEIFEKYSTPPKNTDEYLCFDLNFMMKPNIPDFNKKLNNSSKKDSN